MSAALADIWPARFCCSAASVGAGAGDTGSVVVPTPVQGVQVGGLVVVVVSGRLDSGLKGTRCSARNWREDRAGYQRR